MRAVAAGVTADGDVAKGRKMEHTAFALEPGQSVRPIASACATATTYCCIVTAAAPSPLRMPLWLDGYTEYTAERLTHTDVHCIATLLRPPSQNLDGYRCCACACVLIFVQFSVEVLAESEHSKTYLLELQLTSSADR